jgi:hypothetical protein
VREGEKVDPVQVWTGSAGKAPDHTDVTHGQLGDRPVIPFTMPDFNEIAFSWVQFGTALALQLPKVRSVDCDATIDPSFRRR